LTEAPGAALPPGDREVRVLQKRLPWDPFPGIEGAAIEEDGNHDIAGDISEIKRGPAPTRRGRRCGSPPHGSTRAHNGPEQ